MILARVMGGGWSWILILVTSFPFHSLPVFLYCSSFLFIPPWVIDSLCFLSLSVLLRSVSITN